MVVYSKEIAADICDFIKKESPDSIFIFCDENTERLCLPFLQGTAWMKSGEKMVNSEETITDSGKTVIKSEEVTMNSVKTITIPAGDIHKTTESLIYVWQKLSEGGATRHSLLINLGGGMITDLGGFAAATFKRGIRFINVPTTLLSMVDAAVGGKTGINFNGLKNEVGVFQESCGVIVNTCFLKTLDHENLCSGYAEMLKHALLSDRDLWLRHLQFDLTAPNLGLLQELVAASIHVKEHIVEQDPHEKGLRKALNLGHTIGHAIESTAMEKGRPMLHGYAVAYGLVAELFLSHVQKDLPIDVMRQTVNYIRENYGRCDVFTCQDYERLYELLLHDKKNVGNHILFTLLSDIGGIEVNQEVEKALVFEAFDFLREG